MQDKQLDIEQRGIWHIAAGEGGTEWEAWKDFNSVALGWNDIPDFSIFKTMEELDAYLKRRGSKGERGAKRIWKFIYEMRRGEIIVVGQGESKLFGIGTITSDYLPKTDADNKMRSTGMPHARRVEWMFTEERTFPKHFFGYQPPAFTKVTREQWESIRAAYSFKENRAKFELLEFGLAPINDAPLDPDFSRSEGAKILALRSHYQRDAYLRQKKIESVLQKTGHLECEVPGCCFDFERVYGELGHGFAHVHHLDQIGGCDIRDTKIADLRIVCPNCHAMLHRRKEFESLEGLIKNPVYQNA